MPTVNVKPDSGAELQKIADVLGKSRKVVVITGAGISTKCGIPDFRSEDGLYSLIQAQFDTSLKNPPWQQSNILDIDNRPKKKRKQWYYEVVAPDGQIVDVIDEDLPDPKSEELKLQSRLPSKSTNSTEIFQSSSPATKSCGERSLSRCRSILSDPLEDYPSKGFATSNSSPGPPVSQSTHRSDTCISPQHCLLDCSGWSAPRASNRFSGANSLRQNTTKLEPTAETPSAIIEVIPLTRAKIISKQEPSSLLTISDDERPSKTRSSQPRVLPNIKGRDLFDSMIWSDPFTTSIFYMFISSLRQKIKDVDSTTETHRFIKVLRDGGRLVRTYTQNIDCLEEREGLSTDLTLGPGNRARFHRRNQREHPPVSVARDMNHFRGVEVVLLHGSLDSLRCGLCSRLFNWDECDRSITTAAGAAPDCPHCTDYNSRRRGTGRRGLTIGRLRPDIVLYGEEHPNSSLISPLVTHDLRLGPDILLIMGTSLKVHGLKIMIKEFAKAVHMRGGKVVFVNWTRPSESTWGDVIDYWVEWDCDEWVLDLKKRSTHVWSPQSTIKIEKQKRESGGGTSLQRKKQRPVTLQDENSNGAFIVSRILNSLTKELTDSKNTFKRRSFRSYSLQPIASTSEFDFSKGGTTRTGPRITKAKNRLPPKFILEESNAERDMKLLLSKDEHNPSKDITFYVAGNWSKLGVEHVKENLTLSLTLPITPLELHQALGKLSSNLPKYQDHGSKTHMPVINRPLGKITLATHPPHMSRVPVHTRQFSELRNASHSYGARAGSSSTQSSSEAIFVDEGALPASDGSDAIILKGHAMPEPQLIQNANRISKIMSNREDDAAEATCKPKI